VVEEGRVGDVAATVDFWEGWNFVGDTDDIEEEEWFADFKIKVKDVNDKIERL